MSTAEASTPVDERHPAVIAQQDRLDNLRDDIFRLGLERHVVELELYGYTVIPDVESLSFFDELRETILKLGQEDRDRGRTIPMSGPGGRSYLVAQLLIRGRIFERAVMAEKPLTLVTYLMGESCQISSCHGHARVEGDPPQGMHDDLPFVPDPIPGFVHTCNMMWCTEDFSRESGGTLVVPGSHKRGTHPLPGSSSRNQAVPVEAAKGSVIVFTGSLWHGAGARSIPGVRVGMTVYFSRMYARTQEPLNDLLSDEIVERNPPRFGELIGRYNPYPRDQYGFDMAKLRRYAGKTNDQRG